jgi:serine/threonine protein phosphatase 1
MSSDLAFVGDVHGNLDALRGLLEALGRCEVSHMVFLGDYINKGQQSAGVMAELIPLLHAGRATLLAGNHEIALLEALERADLASFLKMGGATTVRSYVGGRVGPAVLTDFTAALPPTHLEALRRMPLTYETDDLIAQHSISPMSTRKFRITAHVPVGELPRIGPRSAQLDTGCGPDAGRLTGLLWPTLDYIQVDSDGVLVT